MFEDVTRNKGRQRVAYTLASLYLFSSGSECERYKAPLRWMKSLFVGIPFVRSPLFAPCHRVESLLFETAGQPPATPTEPHRLQSQSPFHQQHLHSSTFVPSTSMVQIHQSRTPDPLLGRPVKDTSTFERSALSTTPTDPVTTREHMAIDWKEVKYETAKAALDFLRWVWKTSLWIASKLKELVIVAMFLCAVGSIIATTSDYLSSAISPVCDVPVLGHYVCPSQYGRHQSVSVANAPAPLQWADYPTLMELETRTMEMILDESVDAPAIAIYLRDAALMLSDLAIQVRSSDMQNKDRLADALTEASVNMKKSARGLTKFSAKIGGTVDSILAVGEYSWRAIEADTNTTTSTGLTLWPLFSSPSKNIVVITFTRSMSFFSDELEHLILAASISAENLEILEESLNTVYTILEWEGYALDGEADELATLWSMFGGNRKERRELAKKRNLLGNVQHYRKRAAMIVNGALQAVDVVTGDVENLREKCVRAESDGDVIPLEVHVKSVQSAVERLQNRRLLTIDQQQEGLNRAMQTV